MKKILFIILIFLLTSCVGSSTRGVFGTGVSVALDPRTLGTQIDDSIMQKNLVARLALTEKKYFIKISVKVLDGRFFLGGNVTCDLRHLIHVQKSIDPSLLNNLVPSICVMIKTRCNIRLEWTPYLIRD